ncbi:MAG: hypothetical protein JXM70_14920 [Pirellulales bacterium]|nr:hypothetical protein [Pirellulales bacterium]
MGKEVINLPQSVPKAIDDSVRVWLGNDNVAKGEKIYAGWAMLLGLAKKKKSRCASNPWRGRFDYEHGSYDDAIIAARRNAGDIGQNTRKMYDPETGTLIGKKSANGKQGWRIDEDHINWWDLSGGKKGQGGKYGHDFFPPDQSGPHSSILVMHSGRTER